MGTLLHARGITFEHCFDLLNLEQPALVAEIHNEYIQAGAELIKTKDYESFMSSFLQTRGALEKNPKFRDAYGLFYRMIRAIKDKDGGDR